MTALETIVPPLHTLAHPRSTLLSQCPSIDPNRLDPQGRCPLMLAAEKGSVDIMMQLVERGADPNGCPVHQGRLLYPTPLHVAAEVRRTPMRSLPSFHGSLVAPATPHRQWHQEEQEGLRQN